MGNPFTKAVGNVLTKLMGNVLTEQVGKVLDIYTDPALHPANAGAQPVTVYVSQEGGSAPSATVTLRATSESDPSKTATATVHISR